MDNTNKFGFVYIITNKINGRKYIGRKNYFTSKGKETNWRTYMSSCTELLADIQKYGVENFIRVTLHECSSLEELVDKEAEIQLQLNVLKEIDSNGCKLWYNKNVRGKFYRPPGWKHTDKTKDVLRSKMLIKVASGTNPNADGSSAKKALKSGKHNFYGGAIQRSSNLRRSAKGMLPAQVNPPRGPKNGAFKGFHYFYHPDHGCFYTWAKELSRILPMLKLDAGVLSKLAHKKWYSAYRGWTVLESKPVDIPVLDVTH